MKFKFLLTCAAALAISGCDVDLFNSSCRELGNSHYSLCKSNNGPTVFYLEPNDESPDGGGVVEGTVQRIGWNGDVIVAARRSTFRGDPDGVMVVDLSTKKVSGPLNPDLAHKRYPAIRLLDPIDVWDRRELRH